MNEDGVAAAFQLIIEEIETVASDIAEQGSKAFRDKSYDDAHQLIESGKSLKEFHTKVAGLLVAWQSGIDAPTRKRFGTPRLKGLLRGPLSAQQQTRPRKPPVPHTKSRKTRLRVTFPDGDQIEDDIAADTFVQALHRIGLSEVEAMGFKLSNEALISPTRSKKYTQRRIEGRYVSYHSSTSEKKKVLDRIAKKLGLALKVQVV